MTKNKKSQEVAEKDMVDANTEVTEAKTDAKEILEISVKMMEDGKITVEFENKEGLKEEDMNLSLIDHVLKQAYESVHEQKLVESVLSAFKSKL